MILLYSASFKIALMSFNFKLKLCLHARISFSIISTLLSQVTVNVLRLVFSRIKLSICIKINLKL